jgi:hypothetical protein
VLRSIVCICLLSVGIGLRVHVNVTSKHVNLLGSVRLRGENFRWAALVQVGNVVVRAMALAGLRHGAVPYFRLVHPKVVPFQIQYGSERFGLFGWHRFAGVRFRGLGCGEFFRSQSGSVHTGMCHHFLVCNDVLQHLHPLRPKTAKIESRPQARHWRSHKTVAEVDRCSAIVENHS